MVPKIDQVNPVGNPYERFANNDNVYLKLVVEGGTKKLIAVEKNEKLNFFDSIARKFHLGGFRLKAITHYIDKILDDTPIANEVKIKLKSKIEKHNDRWFRKIFTCLQMKMESLTQEDRQVFDRLRNYFFVLGDPQDDDFQAAQNEIDQLEIPQNAPYILQEAFILAKKRSANSDYTHNTQAPIAAVDEIFNLIKQCESVNSKKDFFKIQKRLNQLSQEQLIGKELSSIPQAVCDALYFARRQFENKRSELVVLQGPYMEEIEVPKAGEYGIIAQRGDGACLFRSLATGLHLNNTPLHDTQRAKELAEKNNKGPDKFNGYLRDEIVNYIDAHKTELILQGEEWVENTFRINLLDTIEIDNEKYQKELNEFDEYPRLDKQVREKIKERIQEKIITGSDDEKVDKYIERMRTPYSWGSQLELQAFCELYQVNVDLYMKQDKGPPTRDGGRSIDLYQGRPTIYLCNERGTHFDVMEGPPKNK